MKKNFKKPEVFMKKNFKKPVKQNSEQKKYLKENVINCMSNGRDMITHLIVGLKNKIDSYKNESNFPTPFRSFGGNINVKIDLFNYATKSHIKNISHVDTSSFALKANLASLKTEIDKLNIGKLTTVPVDLSKLSNVAKMMLLKKLFMINQQQK